MIHVSLQALGISLTRNKENGRDVVSLEMTV